MGEEEVLGKSTVRELHREDHTGREAGGRTLWGLE